MFGGINLLAVKYPQYAGLFRNVQNEKRDGSKWLDDITFNQMFGSLNKNFGASNNRNSNNKLVAEDLEVPIAKLIAGSSAIEFLQTVSRNKDRREREEIYHTKISKKKTNNIQMAKAIINKKKDIKFSKTGAIDKRSKLYKALTKNKNKHTTSDCSYKRIAAAILAKEFGHIPSEAFDSAVDRCYCLKCHNKRGDRLIYKRGNPTKRYALPIGWVRFGLQTNDVICKMNNVWDEWHVAYHGTMKETVSKIFAGGLLLLKPGDVAIGGHSVGVRDGHIPKPFKRRNLYTGTDEMFDPNQIYLSSSIKYAGHECYAKTSVCRHPLEGDKRLKVKFAFQVRVRAESYHVGQETIGVKGVIDEYFDNNELEWYTKETAGIVVYGLLIKFEEVVEEQKKKHKPNFIDLT